MCDTVNLIIVADMPEQTVYWGTLTLLLLNTTCPILANSVDPDHLASEETN